MFGDQLENIRSWFFLGEARAAKGDREGACAAYGKQLDHSGAARPRSLTAEKARRRQRELRCSPPRGDRARASDPAAAEPPPAAAVPVSN